jgi:hypothetical protein
MLTTITAPTTAISRWHRAGRLTNRTLGRSRGPISQDARQRRPDRYHQDTDEAADQDIGRPRILCQAFAFGER